MGCLFLGMIREKRKGGTNSVCIWFSVFEGVGADERARWNIFLLLTKMRRFAFITFGNSKYIGNYVKHEVGWTSTHVWTESKIHFISFKTMKNIDYIFIVLLLLFMLNLCWLLVNFNVLFDIIMFVIF